MSVLYRYYGVCHIANHIRISVDSSEHFRTYNVCMYQIYAIAFLDTRMVWNSVRGVVSARACSEVRKGLADIIVDGESHTLIIPSRLFPMILPMYMYKYFPETFYC